ncbi:hypothetical protein N658DRAFT_231861 [Parathielavia hyrcaniae]|uniref:Uncharacterized protein n=1 Tax=Parathielavia hyrcaniae TaxID=113614 RepID=A0AAN6QAC8_9PEZI|nr:hypothetical protein N658DRAFT_231861 [Parathielavia hyrcaniae]
MPATRRCVTTVFAATLLRNKAAEPLPFPVPGRRFGLQPHVLRRVVPEPPAPWHTRLACFGCCAHGVPFRAAAYSSPPRSRALPQRLFDNGGNGRTAADGGWRMVDGGWWMVDGGWWTAVPGSMTSTQMKSQPPGSLGRIIRDGDVCLADESGIGERPWNTAHGLGKAGNNLVVGK